MIEIEINFYEGHHKPGLADLFYRSFSRPGLELNPVEVIKAPTPAGGRPGLDLYFTPATKS